MGGSQPLSFACCIAGCAQEHSPFATASWQCRGPGLECQGEPLRGIGYAYGVPFVLGLEVARCDAERRAGTWQCSYGSPGRHGHAEAGLGPTYVRL